MKEQEEAQTMQYYLCKLCTTSTKIHFPTKGIVLLACRGIIVVVVVVIILCKV